MTRVVVHVYYLSVNDPVKPKVDLAETAHTVADVAITDIRRWGARTMEQAQSHSERLQLLDVYGDAVAGIVRALSIGARDRRGMRTIASIRAMVERAVEEHAERAKSDDEAQG